MATLEESKTQINAGQKMKLRIAGNDPKNTYEKELTIYIYLDKADGLYHCGIAPKGGCAIDTLWAEPTSNWDDLVRDKDGIEATSDQWEPEQQ